MSLVHLFVALAADPTPITSRIADVTVYPSTALVHRAAEVGGAGSYVLRGLPQSLDADSIRVRADRGAVVSVEVRDRLQEAVPSERVDALKTRLIAAEAEVRVAQDKVVATEQLTKHLNSLMALDQAQSHDETRTGRSNPEAWDSSWAFFSKKIGEVQAQKREADRELVAKQLEVQKIQAEIGRWSSTRAEPVKDVVVEIEGQGAAKLDVEYMVQGTGWQPNYELRTSSDLTKVALTYRAQVFQFTGEDWNDVALALSTAQPQRGAQGPEPLPVWLSLWQPPPPSEETARKSRRPAAAEVEVLSGMGYAGKDLASNEAEVRRSFATVESTGLSVRYQIPRRETVQSRNEPTSVLVGQADLGVAIERTVVPAVDPTVWLRGRAKNTTPYTLLPGAASVFLGQDFLGRASVDLVQPGAELTLHLGADPFLEVERTRTQDMEKGPGFLSSQSSKIEGWRIHIKNAGAPTQAKDGAVEVIVREVLPRPRDERIEVELTKSEPKTSVDERWKQDREEKGILTWTVRVPKAGAADVVWEYTVGYPKGARVVRE
ncbi:MAG: mucoidy inhibitor MuiA family protein [Planctomycetota bacterium]|nr:mucoidy inhibitor MuiA family protein [Planctomycetota bacterium]